MFAVYRPVRETGSLRPFHGPADLMGYAGPIVVEGAPSDPERARWSIALGLAVTRGATVQRRHA